MKELIEKIKQSEGYSSTTYKDSLGINTIGYGTKLPFSMEESKTIISMLVEPYSSLNILNNILVNILTTNKIKINKEIADKILKMRLDNKITRLIIEKPFIKDLPEIVQEVLYEMSYQMGVSELLKFHDTLAFLERRNFKGASIEMLDSKWAKQTPKRAKRLSNIIFTSFVDTPSHE